MQFLELTEAESHLMLTWWVLKGWRWYYFLFPSSCLWRTSYKAQWHHNHPWLAQRIPTKQKLCVASDRSKSVQNLCEVWVFWTGRQWSKWARAATSLSCLEPQGSLTLLFLFKIHLTELKDQCFDIWLHWNSWNHWPENVCGHSTNTANSGGI